MRRLIGKFLDLWLALPLTLLLIGLLSEDEEEEGQKAKPEASSIEPSRSVVPSPWRQEVPHGIQQPIHRVSPGI